MSFTEWAGTTGGSSILGAGAEILSGAFDSGISAKKAKRINRYEILNYNKYALPALRLEKDYDRFQDEIYRNREIQGKVADAKAAGLHPLYALGAAGNYTTPASTSHPGGSMPQTTEGNFASKGLKAVARHYERMAETKAAQDLVEKQAQLSAMKVAESAISNDTAMAAVDDHFARNMAIARAAKKHVPGRPQINPHLEEIEKGKVQTHDPKHRERNKNVMSPMTKVRIGSQDVWVPTDEVDAFLEDPLAVGALTYIYDGNKNVNWAQLYNEYTGRVLTPSEVTKGTKNMFNRLGVKTRKKKRPRFAGPYIPYSRGPHR